MLKETKIYTDKFKSKNNLGCGAEVNMHTTNGFICGIPNAWGTETFCVDCKKKMKKKWLREERRK